MFRRDGKRRSSRRRSSTWKLCHLASWKVEVRSTRFWRNHNNLAVIYNLVYRSVVDQLAHNEGGNDSKPNDCWLCMANMKRFDPGRSS